MLVEHQFVTTKPEADAFKAVHAMLHRLGFEPKRDGQRLTGRRGRPGKTSAKRVRDLPQSVDLTFDRGRVELAVLLEHRGKSKPIHRERLLLMTETIEAAMRADRDAESLAERWQRYGAEEQRLARRQSRFQILAWVLVALGTIVLIGGVIALVNSF